MEFVRRTRATLRSAEFGFFGVVVYTRVQTPRRWGAATFFLRPFPDFKPGVASFFVFGLRPLRTSWDVVGIRREMVAAGRKPTGAPCSTAGDAPSTAVNAPNRTRRRSCANELRDPCTSGEQLRLERLQL